MANEQHLQWLSEGVQAWNTRRRKAPFRPDLTNANLERETLREVNLQGSYLQGAKLQDADLWGINLWTAGLRKADLTTILYPVELSKEFVVARHADMSMSRGLKQDQLNDMLGDSGTILPDGLERPKHWPQLSLVGDSRTAGKNEELSGVDTLDPPYKSDSAHKAFKAQRDLLFQTRIESAAAAELFHQQLNLSISLYRSANPTNRPPEDLLLLEQFSDKLSEIQNALQSADQPQDSGVEERLAELLDIIADLKNTIADQAQQIETLRETKREKTDWQKGKSAFAVTFGTTLGTGAAGITIVASHALLGAYGTSTVQALRNAFTGLFAVSP
ncbi:MAG: pentapeptide repeat-containing protein [Pelagimonas sp.]|jgi:predicted house-cleaning noncanonical NTP pyrophosphatase (MazG superfamily)|nr:pentapeptide repeat-containing protein [Pelagimonas sp.]